MACEYPCTECENGKKCADSKKYRKCDSFMKWFREQWRRLQNILGGECVDSTLEERERDNE